MQLILRSLTLLVGFLLLWQFTVYWFQVPDYFLPSPLQVSSTIETQNSLLLEHALPTLIETLLGFFSGILFGCIAGLLIAYYRPLSLWCLPLLIISQAIPTFAIAPLIVIWLGFGIASKVAITVLMIFFPITSAFYDGLKRTPQDWLDLAHTMNASRWRIFTTIRLPAALPELASGIRIAAVYAPIGAVIGEWVGSSRGLGYLMLNANARLQIDQMFAALTIIVLMALSLYFTVDFLLRKWIWWQSG